MNSDQLYELSKKLEEKLRKKVKKLLDELSQDLESNDNDNDYKKSSEYIQRQKELKGIESLLNNLEKAVDPRATLQQLTALQRKLSPHATMLAANPQPGQDNATNDDEEDACLDNSPAPGPSK